MDKSLKKRKINISIIPHDSSKPREIKTYSVLIPLIILLTIFLLSILTFITIRNLRNINKFSQVKKTKQEIEILSQKNKEIKSNIDSVKSQITDLKQNIKLLVPFVNFFSGEIEKKTYDIELTSNLDTLLFVVEYFKQVSDSALNFIKNRKNNERIPSLVPINGWVLRRYGKILDPFTENEKISKGILFVADPNSDVFSTVSGVVKFAGIKNKKNGNTVIIDSGLYEVEFSHLSIINVRGGEYVKKGQKIGIAGKTGRTLTSSVFYKITRNNEPIDPENSFLIPIYFFYDTLSTNL